MIAVGDAIDVSRHHNAIGQMYGPGEPWGVRCLKFFGQDALATPVSSRTAKTRKLALERASRDGAGDGMVAIAFRRSDGRVVGVFAGPNTRSLDSNSIRA